MMASIIIPVYNEAQTLGDCLASLARQTAHRQDLEIIVVDDGSTDNTPDVVRSFPGVRLLTQRRQGPAAARNRGAREATGEIILFTDGDCIPLDNWLEEMLAPFSREPDLTGVKGAYLTRQRALTARFVQIEYEDKYDKLASQKYIDFIDTYSAGYRRRTFLEVGGFDQEFPVACAEDVELSYRLANLGCKLVFNPRARVIHRHPDRIRVYLKKKFKFAYWRMLSVKKHPNKILADSHTPQSMKVQLLLFPTLIASLFLALVSPWLSRISFAIFLLAFLTTLPFVIKAIRKDAAVGFLSPLFLIVRSGAQFLGVLLGLLNNLPARGIIRS
jgi:cellulose synthase/poly-beta-1,6-N-acetylglucosamine synthase-like glycosyltransferase